MELQGKKVVVVGLAKTGLDTAEFLVTHSAQVYLTEEKDTAELREKAVSLEKKGVKLELGGHSENFLKGASLVVPSPGVTPQNPVLQWANHNEVPIWSEVELAYRFSPSKKIVAISGTNGKTTTTALTGFLFQQAGLPKVVCGNIGNTFIGELNNIHSDTWIVLEISSFQLEYINTFCPFIAVLLNVTPDHLDRYASFVEYSKVKKRLFSHQKNTDWAVLNYQDSFCRGISQSLASQPVFFSAEKKLESGVFVQSGHIMSTLTSKEESLFDLDQTKLFGTGNIQNMLAVSAVALICGLKKDILRKTLREFQPLPHRLERVAEIKGVTFINDSKSTNVDSVRQALLSFPPEQKIILIMGGKDKGFSFSELVGLVRERVKILLLLGETRDRIKHELSPAGVRMEIVANLKSAVERGVQEARTGEVVLLSPGCSSFDMFQDYQERGNVFKKEVQALL